MDYMGVLSPVNWISRRFASLLAGLLAALLACQPLFFNTQKSSELVSCFGSDTTLCNQATRLSMPKIVMVHQVCLHSGCFDAAVAHSIFNESSKKAAGIGDKLHGGDGN